MYNHIDINFLEELNDIKLKQYNLYLPNLKLEILSIILFILIILLIILFL